MIYLIAHPSDRCISFTVPERSGESFNEVFLNENGEEFYYPVEKRYVVDLIKKAHQIALRNGRGSILTLGHSGRDSATTFAFRDGEYVLVIDKEIYPSTPEVFYEQVLCKLGFADEQPLARPKISILDSISSLFAAA